MTIQVLLQDEYNNGVEISAKAWSKKISLPMYYQFLQKYPEHENAIKAHVLQIFDKDKTLTSHCEYWFSLYTKQAKNIRDIGQAFLLFFPLIKESYLTDATIQVLESYFYELSLGDKVQRMEDSGYLDALKNHWMGRYQDTLLEKVSLATLAHMHPTSFRNRIELQTWYRLYMNNAWGKKLDDLMYAYIQSLHSSQHHTVLSMGTIVGFSLKERPSFPSEWSETELYKVWLLILHASKKIQPEHVSVSWLDDVSIASHTEVQSMWPFFQEFLTITGRELSIETKCSDILGDWIDFNRHYTPSILSEIPILLS